MLASCKSKQCRYKALAGAVRPGELGVATSTASACVDEEGGLCSRGPVREGLEAFIEATSDSTVGKGASKEASKEASKGASKGANEGGPKDPVAAAVAAAAAARGVQGEAGLLEHPEFVAWAGAQGITREMIAETLESHFKFPAGAAREHPRWLSNHMIDGTLERWRGIFPNFYYCKFAMADWENCELARYDWGPFLAAAPGGATFACVHNTARTSDRSGKHWVTTFIDTRAPSAPTVEYFNSTGRPPAAGLARWLGAARDRLARALGGAQVTLWVNDVDHQEENQTECGVYALYYIRRRLEGTPATFFQQALVPDEAMREFRRHLFR